ncbi:tetratricopeptide repeat protein [Trichothermofontia sp.]
MGRYAEAEPLYVRSLHLRETQLGADHPDTASSLNNLAGLYRAMGRYAEAEPLYQRSLDISETQLGADHPDTASSLNHLAELYRAMSCYAEAEPLLLRALAIWEQTLGSNHPNTQNARQTLTRLRPSSSPPTLWQWVLVLVLSPLLILYALIRWLFHQINSLSLKTQSRH